MENFTEQDLETVTYLQNMNVYDLIALIKSCRELLKTKPNQSVSDRVHATVLICREILMERLH